MNPAVQGQKPENLSDAMRLESQIQRTLGKIPNPRRITVAKFLDELAANRKSASTRLNYVNAIYTLRRQKKPFRGLTEELNKPYEGLIKKDFIQWTKWLDKTHAEASAIFYRIIIRRFIRWVHNGEDGGEYPEPVRWMKARFPKRRLGKPVLSFEEIKQLVDSADNPRDRAMLFVLYESGCRAGEFVGLKCRDVEFDQFGAKTRVDGKTGERVLRIFNSTPDLTQWLNVHPRREPDASLWVSLQEPYLGIRRRELRSIVRKYAKKTGLLKTKKLSPHSFRHTRATHLAHVFKEAELREFFGWTKDSEMPAIYVHLSGRDVDETLLRHYGIISEQSKPNEDLLAKKPCPRCKLVNSASSRFCTQCGAALDVRTAIDLDQFRAKTNDMVAEVVESLVKRAPDLVEQILQEKGFLGELQSFIMAQPMPVAEMAGSKRQ